MFWRNLRSCPHDRLLFLVLQQSGRGRHSQLTVEAV
jgi:hypothetical protein